MNWFVYFVISRVYAAMHTYVSSMNAAILIKIIERDIPFYVEDISLLLKPTSSFNVLRSVWYLPSDEISESARDLEGEEV